MKFLLEKIKKKKAVIGVIGLGYVGLPLALEFAKKGFRVKGVDLDEEKVSSLRRGKSYVGDVKDTEVKSTLKRKTFMPFSDTSALNDTDVVIICVPTPLRKTREPDVSYIIQAVESILSLNAKKRLIILESTTYPGTTEEVIAQMLMDAGLVPKKDFLLVFSPERVDPGNKNYKTKDIPKVVGGIDPLSTKIAAALYQNIIPKVIQVSSTQSAEMVKLLENTFRIVNIGLVNELAMMCDKMNINVWEVIEAAATKPFGFMPFYPGPGLGGHCIPIDPLYLSWKARMFDFEARFIDLASQINRMMPQYVIQKTIEALNERRKSIKSAKIYILGLAYKKDVHDIRESPALDIISALNTKGAKIFIHDPYYAKMDGHIQGVYKKPTPANLKSMDCVLLITDHLAYKKQIKNIVKNCSMLIDTRYITKGIKSSKIVLI